MVGIPLLISFSTGFQELNNLAFSDTVFTCGGKISFEVFKCISVNFESDPWLPPLSQPAALEC